MESMGNRLASENQRVVNLTQSYSALSVCWRDNAEEDVISS